jgi:hypothetical protein
MNAPFQSPRSDVHLQFCETEESAHSAFDRIIDDAEGEPSQSTSRRPQINPRSIASPNYDWNAPRLSAG